MNPATWKKWERDCAKDLGGERTGARGLALPDITSLDPPLAPECKCRQGFSVKPGDVEQAQRNCKGDPWVVLYKFIRGKGRNNLLGKYAFMEYDYYIELERLANGREGRV